MTNVFGKLEPGHHIGNRNSSASLQDPENFGKNTGLVRRQVENAVQNNDVDQIVSDRKILDFTQAKLHVVHRGLSGIFPGLCHHLGGHIHPNDVASLSDFPGRKKGVEPGPRSKIQDSHSLPDSSIKKRCPAPQAQIRPFGNRLRLLPRISEFEGLRILCLSAGAWSATSSSFFYNPGIAFPDKLVNLGHIPRIGFHIVLLPNREGPSESF